MRPEREDVIADTGAGKWMFMKGTGRVKNPQPTATMIRVAKPGTDGLIGNVVEGDLRLSVLTAEAEKEHEIWDRGLEAAGLGANLGSIAGLVDQGYEARFLKVDG
eukprot:883285-Rhodomonas_salina.3